MAVYKISANGKEGRIDSAAFEKEYDILLKKYPDLKVRVLRGDQLGYIPATNYHKAIQAGFKPYSEPDKPEASVQPAAQDTPSQIQPGAPKQQPIDLSAPAQAPAMIKTDPNLPSSPEQQLEAEMTKQGEELLQQDEVARQALKEQARASLAKADSTYSDARERAWDVKADIAANSIYTPGGAQYRPKQDPEKEQEQNAILQQEILAKSIKEKAKEAVKIITEIERENKNFFVAAGRGIGQTVSEASTWDMGITDIVVNNTIKQTADKFAQDPESLTDAERDLLEASALELAVNYEFGDELTRGYKAGQVTGEALPFMAEIALNPLSGTGRAASKWAIKKFGTKGFASLVKRYGTRVAADAAGAAGMAATTGLGHVAADTQARMTGQAQSQVDENGYIVYTGHAGGEELPSALAKAYGAQSIEYFSEMSGEYFAKLSPLTRKITPKRVINMLDNIKASDWAKVVDDFATKTQWQGTINEWAEEQVGTALNAMFVGDQEISDLWDLDQQIDTFLGVALMGSAFSVARTAGYRSPKHRAAKELEKARKSGSQAFGAENWEDIQAEIDNASDEQLHAIVKQAVNAARQVKTPAQQDENNPINLDDPINNQDRDNQIAAGMVIANYVAKLQQQRGANLVDMKRKTEGEVTPEQLQLENSFYEGVNKRMSIRKAKKELEEAAKDIDPSIDEVIQTPAFIASIPGRQNAEQILRYANAKARYDGLMQSYSDDIEDQVQSASERIKSRTDKAGNLTLAETITGEKVHIISGNIAFDQEGFVDKAHSEDKPVIAVDQEGNKKMLSLREISRLLDQTNADEATNAIAEEIRNTVAAQAEQEAETPEPEEIQQALEGVNVQDVVQLNLNEKPTTATIQSIDPATGEILLQLDEPILNEQGKKQKVISMPADQFTKALIRNDKPGDEPPAAPPAAAGQLIQTKSTDQPTMEPETQAQAPVKEFPKDKEGYIDYSQITEPQDFLDALMIEFSPEDAAAVVEDYVAEAEKAIKAAEKEKDPVKKRRKVAAERANAEKYIQMRDILKKRREAEQAERLKADIEKRNQAKMKSKEAEQVEKQKADIKKRIQEEIDKATVLNTRSQEEDPLNEVYYQATKELDSEAKDKLTPKEYKKASAIINMARKNDWSINQLRDKLSKEFGVRFSGGLFTISYNITINEINAKYAAELDALEAQITPHQKQQAQQPIEQTEPEQQEDISNVPDITLDSVKDARARGFRKVDGVKVERKPKADVKLGAKTVIKFALNDEQEGAYVLTELDEVQPSHINDRKNPLHFLNDAQPKKREKKQDSKLAAGQIAKNFNPVQATENVVAYHGAPIINARKEVIQGNGRTSALHELYNNYQDNAEAYKQYLIDNAQRFGINPEEVRRMKKPALVRLVDVSDERAIQLGNYGPEDIESGVDRKMNITNVVNVLGEKITSFVKILYHLPESIDEENRDKITIRELAKRNGENALKYLFEQEAIGPGVYESAFSDTGGIKPEFIDALMDLSMQLVFKNGKDNLKTIFEDIVPSRAQMAIIQTIHREADVLEGNSFLEDIQEAIEVCYYLSKDPNLKKTRGNIDQAIKTALLFSRQSSMDLDGNEGVFIVGDKYSELSIVLVAHFYGLQQKELKQKLDRLYDDLSGQKDIFAQGEPALTKSEAIKKHFNVEYNERRKNEPVPPIDNSRSLEGGRAGHEGDAGNGPGIQRAGKADISTTTGATPGGEPGQSGQGEHKQGAGSAESRQDAEPVDIFAEAEKAAKKAEIKKEEEAVNTDPSQEQKEAGNYKKGHIQVQGLDITIENPKGSERTGTDQNGKKWSVTMNNTYGYFKRTKGKDGDQVDVFIGENPLSETVFVVDQINPQTGEFDESKVMLGFDSEEQAQQAYMANYSPGWKGFGSITQVPIDKFKTWLNDGARQIKAFAEYKEFQNQVPESPISEDKERLNRMLAEGLGSIEKRDEEGKSTKTSVITGEGRFDADTGVKYPFSLYDYFNDDNGDDSLIRYGDYLTLDDAKAELEHKDGPIPVRHYHGQKYNGIAESTFRIALSKGELDKNYDWEWIEYPRVKGKGFAVGRLKPLENKEQPEVSQQEQEAPAPETEKAPANVDIMAEAGKAVKKAEQKKQEEAVEERKQRMLNEGSGFDKEFGLIALKDIKSADDALSNLNKIISTLKLNEGNGKFKNYEGYAYKGDYSKNAGEQVRDYFITLDVLPNEIKKDIIEKLNITTPTGLSEWAAKQYSSIKSESQPENASPELQIKSTSETEKDKKLPEKESDNVDIQDNDQNEEGQKLTKNETEAENKESEVVKKAQQEAEQALDDFLDAFNDLNSPNLGIVDNSAEKQAKMLVAGTRMVAAYTKLGVYKFADLVNKITQRGIHVTEELLSALKKAYGAFMVESDIEELDDIKTVRNFKLSDIAQKEEAPSRNTKQAFMSAIKERIASKQPIKNTPALASIAEQAGYKFGSGYKTIKELYDAASNALNQYILESGQFSVEGKTIEQAKADLDMLNELQDLLPTETQRSAEQVDLQQFSTPLELSYVVNRAARVTNNDTALEPSAGEGNIAIFAKASGAEVIANEIDESRKGLLENLGLDKVIGEDAKHLHAIAALKNDKVTVVVMNPPFSRDIALGGKMDLHAAEKHIEAALNKLEEGGRLVAIVGKGMSMESQTHSPWWNKIKKKYLVQANILLPGSAYSKKGTNFDNRILVIDKTGETFESSPIITGEAESYLNLLEIIEGLPNREKLTFKDKKYDANSNSRKGEAPRNAGNEQRQRAHSPADVRRDTPIGNEGEYVRPGQDREYGPDIIHGSGYEGGKVSPAGNNRGRNNQEDKFNKDGSGRSSNTPDGSSLPGYGGIFGQLPNEPENVPGRKDAQVNELKLQRNTKTAKQSDKVGYDDYVPEITIEGSKPHPTKLVESTAMAGVSLPELTYVPQLSKKVVESGALSDAQLEDVILAGNSHQQKLTNGYRRGFFLGAGTGYGKGRTIGAIILDNWNQGRKKAVWISKNDKAHYDSPEYWESVGGDPKAIFTQKNAKKHIQQREGVLLFTYGTLASGFSKTSRNADDLSWDTKTPDNRLQQLAQWLGKDFDGVIVFDESHKMANAKDSNTGRGTKKASITALAGLELQRLFPNARIVYSSATGATEVTNLIYAQRLGLWGDGTPFADPTDFVSAVESSGVAGMEIISRDLKAMGLYTAKSISFDGVEYGSVQHDITPAQKDLYNQVAKAWQIVLKNIKEAIEDNNTDSRSKSAAMSAFWGAHQRFFSSIIITMQMPSTIEDVQKSLDEGKAVVLQLVNTNEAQQKRSLAKAKAELGEGMELDYEDIDVSPKQTLIDFLTKAFPVQLFEESIDENGNTIRVKVVDSEGKPVLNPESVAKRDALIDKIDREIHLPEAPIDIIINTFGSENVAEVTGRSSRIVTKLDENGNPYKIEESRTAKSAANDKDAFMDGRKDILIFSDAGGTGASFHSDRTKKNQKQRVHYVLQAGWRADGAVQGFGRTHRANQRTAPIFKLVTTNLKAQKRFLSSIAKRLDQLGALTKGQRQAGGQGILDGSFNLEGTIARQALFEFYQNVEAGTVEGVTIDVLEEQMSLVIYKTDDSGVRKYNEDVVFNTKMFLNRLMSLEVDLMDAVFEGFIQQMEENINIAKAEGKYDEGIEVVSAISTKVVDEIEIHTDQATGAKTFLTTIELELPNKKKSLENIKNDMVRYGDRFEGFYKEKNSGRVYAVVQQNVVESDGTTRRRYRRFSVVADSFIDWQDYKDKYEQVDDVEAENLWNTQYAEYPDTRKRIDKIVKGLILPIWNRLPQSISVRRYIDDSGTPHLGRYFVKSDIEQIIKSFNAQRSESFPTDLVLSTIKKKGSAKLANGFTFSLRKYQGNDVVIIGNTSSYRDRDRLTRAGASFNLRSGAGFAMTGDYMLPLDAAESGINKIIELYSSQVISLEDIEGNPIKGIPITGAEKSQAAQKEQGNNDQAENKDLPILRIGSRFMVGMNKHLNYKDQYVPYVKPLIEKHQGEWDKTYKKISFGTMEGAQAFVKSMEEESNLPFIKDSGIRFRKSDRKAGNDIQQAEGHLESEQAVTYTELSDDEVPKDTQVAYKLMRYFKNEPGVLYPLYAKDNEAGKKGFKKDKWYKAEKQSVKIGGKDLANRPGIHAVDLPLFLQGKVKRKGEIRVWVKVLLPAMSNDTQVENDNSPVLTNGQREGIRSRLIGPKEAYNFKTNPAATGANAWPIAGSMKILEVLSDEEVKQILRDNGKEEYIETSMTGDPDIRFRKSGEESPQMKLSNKVVGQIFDQFVEEEQDALEDALFNWADVEIVVDKVDGQVYDYKLKANAGRDSFYSTGVDSAPYKPSKKAFIEWLMSDQPLSKEFDVDQEWKQIITALRNIVNSNTAATQQNARFRKTDAAGFYSTVEAALEAIPQDKGTPGQMKAMLLKNGAKQAELDWMGWDDQFPDATKKASKEKQLDIIQSTNPMRDDNHVGIRALEDIKTFDQVVDDPESFVYGDFSKEDAQKALKEGFVTVYSSTPIKNGAFVSTSEKQAKDYAGNGKVYSQKVNLGDVAWINGDEGQLAKADNTITKAEIQSWIDQNRIEVEEVVKNDVGYTEDDYIQMTEDAESWNNLLEKEYDGTLNKRGEERISEFEEKYGSLDDLYKTIGIVSESNKISDTKYSQYQEPGGKNYKEFVLTMPDQIEPYKPDNIHFTEEGGGTAVVWVRANEREVNGERVLFLEEIQSKRGQDGREKGFKTDKLPDNVKIREVGGMWQVLVDGRLKGEYKTEARAKEVAMEDFGGVPSMPFSKTDQWVNLALRRMMRYAAENGFDRIAWTNGEQQADRYDLSKQVDYIDREPAIGNDVYVDISASNSMINLVVGNDGIIKYQLGDTRVGDLLGKKLEEVIGKEITKKILDEKSFSKVRYSGIDLKVGGEGMKAFYDAIVPSAASKLGKPFGAKVEQIELPENLKKITKGQAFTVQSIPVTDKMYESVMQGIPLYKMTEELRQKIGVVSQAKLAVLRSFFDKVSKDAVNAVDIVVVDSRDELPQELQNKMPDDLDVQGFYYTGDNKAYFILNEIQRPELAFRTWVHEVGVHAGLRSIIPARDFSRLMRKIYNDLGQDEIRRVIPKAYWSEDIEEQAEEYLAFIGEKIIKQEDLSKKEQSIWNKIVDSFLDVLNKLFKNGRFTKQDAESLIMASVQNSFRGSNGRISGDLFSGQSGQTGILQRNDRTPATTDSGAGEGTIFAAAKDALKRYEQRKKETAAQLQINWEAESGDVPARRDKAIASSTTTSVLQRKAGYDPDISTGVSYVERLITNRGHVTFMGDMLTGPAKIKSAGDIAFIFKNLESAATENTFFVFTNDKGEYRVLYVGTGSSSGAVVDVSQIAPAAKEFGATKVCMVHNHPSGNLNPSSSDAGLHRRVSAIADKLGVTVMPSIIINTDSGEYAEFDQGYPMKAERPTEIKAKPVDVYQFDRQKLYKATKERKKIRGSRDVAEFLSQQKRGAVDKLHLIIADRQNVISRYLLVDGKIKTDNLISLILEEAGRHGEAVFIATNGRLDDAKYIRASLKAAEINLLDVLEIKQNDDIVNNYRSLSDQMLLEPEAVYGNPMGATIYIDGVERSTTNSEGKQIAPTEKEVRSFYKWFGNSKMVDDQGRPKVVYHGTDAQFDTFNDVVTYFTDKLDDAQGYADFRSARGVPRVIGAYLNITNPASADKVIEVAKKEGVDVDSDSVASFVEIDKVKKELQRQGYDGTKDVPDFGFLSDFDDINTHAVFNKNQVLTFEDKGTDPDGNNILFRKSDKEEAPETQKAQDVYEQALERTTINILGHKWTAINRGYLTKEGYQDSMLSLKIAQDAIAKETGQDIQDFEDAYTAENHLSSINAAETESYNHNYLKPMFAAVKAITDKGAEYEDVKAYVMAKHGLERNRLFAWRDALKALEGIVNQESIDSIIAEHDERVAHFKEAQRQGSLSRQEVIDKTERLREGLVNVYKKFRKDDYSGLTDLTDSKKDFEEKAEALVEAFEKKYPQETADLWESINAATKRTLQKQFEGSLLTREMHDYIKGMFEYYVPLRGFDEDTATDMYEYYYSSESSFNAPIKKAEGRKSLAEDPFANIGNMAQSGILQANRNLMKQKLLNLALNHPTSLLTVREVWYKNEGTTEKPKWVKSFPEFPENATPEQAQQAIQEHDKLMRELEAKEMAQHKRTKVKLNYKASKRQISEHIVMVKSAGKEYAIYVNGNPRMAQAVNGLTNPDTGKIYSAIGQLNRQLAANFTTRNPAFVFSNMSRDIIFASTAVGIKEDAAYRRKFRGNLGETMLKIVSLMKKFEKGTLDMNIPLEKAFSDFMSNGGETGYTALYNLDNYKSMMQKHIRKAKGITLDPIDAGRAIVDGIGFMNRCAEDISRFAVYYTSRQMGRSVQRSIKDAKEITVNFNKKGSGVMGARHLRTYYLFFNAAVQSLDNFSKLAKKDPKRFTATLASYIAAGVAIPVLNSFLISLFGDDDDKEAYNNLPDWIRRNNLCLYVSHGKFITIPLPIEMRAFYGLGELFTQWASGHMKYDNVGLEVANQILDLLPLNPIGAEGDIAGSIFPDFAKPFAQVWRNKDYFGRPVYKKHDYNTLMPAWTKAYAGTNKQLVKSAELLNDVTGGDKYTKGLDVNPAAIEHIFEGYLGGMGKTINQLGKTIELIWSKDDMQWRNVPVLNRFFSDTKDSKSAFREINKAYYYYMDELKETAQRLRGYEKEANLDIMGYAEKLDKLYKSPAYVRYEIHKLYDKDIREKQDELKMAETPEEREAIEIDLYQIKAELIQELEATEKKKAKELKE